MAKLTKKLLLSYFMIVLFLVALGVSSIVSVSHVSKNVDSMYVDRLVPLTYIAEIGKYSENTRVYIITAATTQDPTLTKNAEENLQYLEEQIQLYKKSNMMPEEAKKFEEFQGNWRSYTDSLMTTIEMIRNGHYAQAHENIALADELFTTADMNLKELIKMNKLAASELIADSKHDYEQTRLFLIVFSVFIIILAVVIGIFVGQQIVPPLKKISERANAIAQGDLTGEPIQLKNKDEIGDLAKSVNQMISHLRNVVSKVFHSSEELTAVSEEMAASSEQVSAASIEISNTMKFVAQNADIGNHSVVDASKVLLELSSLIQIAKSKATSALQTSETTYTAAKDGKEIVNDSIRKMETIRNRTMETQGLIQKLDQYSQEIGHITQMITSIADQTNLLALNASIEAARAGEHGRGFAVVAEEVRKLAEQSNDGANKVAELVKKISGSTGEVVKAIQLNKTEVEQGVSIVATAGNALDQILSDVSKTLKEVNSITNVTDEEVASSDKIVTLIGDLSTVMENTASGTEEVASAGEETSSAIETVSGSAEEVSAMASELQSTVHKFKI